MVIVIVVDVVVVFGCTLLNAGHTFRFV